MFYLFMIVCYCSITANTVTISPGKTTKTDNQSQINVPSASNFTHKNLSMCDVYTNSSVQDPYCICSDSVISCNFVNESSEKPLVIHLSARNITKSIKRICVCNTNRYVYIALKKDFLPVNVKVHRVDFYNLNAEIYFAPKSFLNFGGDLYLSKVKYLNRMHNLQFGREDFEVEDVKDLECCSKVKTSPFDRPTLYVENTTIGSIGSFGIYPNHLWKTIVFKFVRIQKGMDRNAIVLHDGVNASFSYTFFNNLSDRAIVADNMDNFVLIKSTFNHSCHPLAFGAKSNNLNSTIVLIGNRFLNVPQLHLEAKEIINWFNFYESWNNNTFVVPKSSVHKNQLLSVEFNTAGNFSILPDFPTLNNDSTVIFNENILSLCNCSTWKTSSLPSLFKNHRQRCDAHFEIGNSGCTLNLQRFIDNYCKSNSAPDMSKLCQDSKISLPLVQGTELFNLTFHTLNVKLNPPFALRMIKEHEKDSLYRMQNVFQYSKLHTYTEEFEANDSIECHEGCSNRTNKQYQSPAKNESSSKSAPRERTSNCQNLYVNTVTAVLLSIPFCQQMKPLVSILSATTVNIIVFSLVLTFVAIGSIVYLLKRKFALRPKRHIHVSYISFDSSLNKY